MKPKTSSSQQATTTTNNSFINTNHNNNNNQSLAIDGLHDVYLSKCALFGLRPAPAVAQRLRHFDRTRARAYDFSGIPAGDTFRCILDALIAAPDLETLVWRGGGLTDSHVEALVNAARRFIGLESIDLGENAGITDVGGSLLLKFILDCNNNNNKHDGGKTGRAKATTTSVNLVQTSCTAAMIKKIQATQIGNGRNNASQKNSGESTPIGISNNKINNNNNYVMSPPLREYLNGKNKNENAINSTEAGLSQTLEQQRNKINEVYHQQQQSNNNINPSSSTTKANTHHVLNALTIFHSIICHLLALALWIPHNRFKTLIYCFSYFVGVVLTFGPSSSVMDTMAITMIFIGVQRWRQYYAKATTTTTTSNNNNNNEINGLETTDRDGSNGMNVFASTFAHLTQGARRRWSEFLDPLEQLTNMLNVATKKQEEIMSFSSSSSLARKRQAFGEGADEKNIHLGNGYPDEEQEAEKIFHGYYQQQIEGDLRDEQDQNNVILFEQMVRNCVFQYIQFLLNVIWFDPQTHFIFFGTATISVVSAFVVRLVTGYSAFAVGIMFVIWGALFFGIEPVLASDLLLLPFDEDALNNGGNIRNSSNNNNSNNSNGSGSLSSSTSAATRSARNLNLSAIIRFYRVRVGRWIAGNPVRSADDDDAAPSNGNVANAIASNFSSGSASPIMPSLLQQNGKHNNNNNNNNNQPKTSFRRDPFSFVVEIIRIEDCIIRTSNNNNNGDNNNNKPIIPLAKVRCMNKSWTTSEGDARSSYSTSTHSHITTSAAWARGESSQPFNSPHPFDTAKMTFSIYDTSPSPSMTSTHGHNFKNNYQQQSSSMMMLSSYDDGILEVLLQGTFLIDDDLAFGTEIAIPLKNMVLVNEGNNNPSSSNAAAGSGSGRGGIWSLSEMLLRQIDEKDAGERIKHVVPGNGNLVGNHQKSNRNNNDNNNVTSSSATSSLRKEYFVERAGVLIIRFTEVGGDQKYIASTQTPVDNNHRNLQIPPRLLHVPQQNEKSLNSTTSNNNKNIINNAKPSAEPLRFDNDDRELIDYDDDNDEVMLNHHQKQVTRNSKSTTTTASTATTASPVPRRQQTQQQQQQQQQNPPILVVTGSRESKTSTSPVFPPVSSGAGPPMKNKDPNFLSVEVLQRHDTQEEIFLDHEQNNPLLPATDNNRPMNRRNSSQILTFNQQVAISSGRVASNVPSGNNNLQRIATTKKNSDTRSQGSVQYLPDEHH